VAGWLAGWLTVQQATQCNKYNATTKRESFSEREREREKERKKDQL
jgi:hypothetical protein